MSESKISLTKALMTLRIAGETTPAFAAQLSQLTEEDKAWYKAAFEAEGISIA